MSEKYRPFWTLSQYHVFLSLSSLTFISQTLRAWISGTAFLLAEYVILKLTQNAKKLLNRKFYGSRTLFILTYSL